MTSGLIKIADGNSKLGRIPNISIVPGKDCGNCTACVKGCYAVKFYRMYPSVRSAWTANSELAHGDREGYMRQIREYLTENRPAYFRWHVAGDILDQAYLEEMKLIAREYPKVRFLAFTKMHMLEYKRIPKNLAIVASMWPGLAIPANVRRLPKAWLDEGNEKGKVRDARIPKTAIPCPGRCDECGMCWALPQLGRDVVFHKH
jgi:ferredoxin